jgi:superfamily II DNA or RNA helicase
MLCAPTGSGKTLLSAAIIDSALQKRRRAAFVVSSLSLIDQAVEAFYAEGIRDIGVIQASHPMEDWSRSLQVCSIQTLNSRSAFPQADLIIMDEAHVLHKKHKEWLETAGPIFIGLSATPGTRGLGKYFVTLITVSTTAELIEQGYLSPFRVFAASHPDLSKVATVAGDYVENQLSAAMQEGTLTADIVRTYREKWGKGKTLCFAVDLAHARCIQERFLHAGVSCGFQEGATPGDERREIRRKFHSGEYEVVVNVGTLTTGTDWNVHCLILARPTKSEMLFQQIIGRALRTAEGKEYALILDHTDTTARLGFVTEIDWSELDDGKPKDKKQKDAKERKEPLPKECESCAYLKPARIKVCPNCGHENKVISVIVEQPGELTEIIPGKLRNVSNKKAEHWSDQEKKVFLIELKGYAMQHGYKPGWSAAQYREKFGDWPPRYWSNLLPSPVMSPGTALWIRSRNIAYAHRRRRETAQ